MKCHEGAGKKRRRRTADLDRRHNKRLCEDTDDEKIELSVGDTVMVIKEDVEIGSILTSNMDSVPLMDSSSRNLTCDTDHNFIDFKTLDTGHGANLSNGSVHSRSSLVANFKSKNKVFKRLKIMKKVEKSTKRNLGKNLKKYFWLKCNFCGKVSEKDHLFKTCPLVAQQKCLDKSSSKSLPDCIK